jgi:hypothetical protein
MRHVTIPITSINGAKNLTHDQRNLLIILEDVTLRFAGAETFALSRLPELKADGHARSYCADVQEIIRHRMLEIRRGWGGDRADGYEDALEETVAACKPELDRLRHEIRAALAQKVRYNDIDRAMHIATASGLIDCCSRCHEWLTGKRKKYTEARYALGMVDKLLGCGLLNDGKMPDMQEAQAAFSRLFDAVCKKTLDFFTEKQTEN